MRLNDCMCYEKQIAIKRSLITNNMTLNFDDYQIKDYENHCHIRKLNYVIREHTCSFLFVHMYQIPN